MSQTRLRWVVILVPAALALALAGRAFAAESSPLEHQNLEEHDPYQGMDRNGRIPAIEKPADLPNPDRWRYIPEGRLKPGNVFQRFLVTSFVVPFVFRNSDTGVGGGLAFTDIDFRAKRRREFAGLFASYTEKGQRSAWAIWRRWLHHRELPEGGVLQEERSFISVSGGYQKTLTRRFFGFGPDSLEDDEIKYTEELFDIDVELQLAIPEPGANLVGSVGVSAEVQQLSTDDLDCPDVFDPMSCAMGGFDKIAAFRDFIDSRDVEQAGFLSVGLRWDTRDSQRNPYTGFQVGGFIDAPLVQREGDVGAILSLSASAVFTMPPIFHDGGDGEEENPPTDTLAVAVTHRMKFGDVPFTSHPTLGGSETLRGYEAGRFRDDASWHAGVEHRVWVVPRGFEITPYIRVERIGFAPFFEAGTVGSNGIDVFRNEVKFSYGVGLRVMLERAAPFRVDFGWSKHGFNWSAGFGYTF